MLKIWQFWILTALAIISAALAGTNAVLLVGAQKAQAEVAQRAQYVQQTIQLEGLLREIVKALADLSMRNQDNAVREMLASHGVNVGGPVPGPVGGPSAGTKKGNP